MTIAKLPGHIRILHFRDKPIASMPVFLVFMLFACLEATGMTSS
jgi:hypothetical protein